MGGGFGKGYKVIKGYDLVGDAYTGSNTPKPDSDPLDACGAASGASGKLQQHLNSLPHFLKKKLFDRSRYSRFWYYCWLRSQDRKF